MKKILIVEDESSEFKIMKWVLGKITVRIIWARSLEEGRALFNKNKDVDAIIMDACLGHSHDTPVTMSLVKEIVNSGYVKPIITASSHGPYNALLMEAGATHNGENKINAAFLASKLLK